MKTLKNKYLTDCTGPCRKMTLRNKFQFNWKKIVGDKNRMDNVVKENEDQLKIKMKKHT